MLEMKACIVFKLLKSRRMTEDEFRAYMGNSEVGGVDNSRFGYMIEYPPVLGDGSNHCDHEGYLSWCPSGPYEKHHLEVPGDGTKITSEMVDGFVDSWCFNKMGPKTTVCVCTLKNGYIIVTSSSCVDPANYDEAIGKELSMASASQKIWGHLGFLLQTARHGVAE